MTLALDISHFTHENSGPLTKQQLDDAWDAGVRVFRPSIANQSIAVQQIDAIVDHDKPFDIWTYRYYYYGMGMTQVQVDKAFIQRVRDLKFNIQRHSIDVEDTNPNFTPQQRINWVHEWINGFKGFCPTDLYTAYWYWTQFMGNTQEFKFMPLWNAWWPKDKTASLAIPPALQYGGWTRAAMHQYIGDVSFAGIWCDVNYFEDAVAPPPEPIVPPVINQGVYLNTEYDEYGQARKITLEIVG